MRLPLIGFVLFFFIVLDDAARIVQAQPYCAMYSNGTQDCGIPTLQSCDQSISGVGGYCAPDTTAQLRPNLIDRWRADQSEQSPQPLTLPPADTSQDSPNWLPPPPPGQ